MRCKPLLLVLSASLLAGCGKSTTSPSFTSPTGPSPTPTTTTNVQVSNPVAGASVTSPFQIAATASTCQSQAVTAMGYAIDAGTKNQLTGSILQVAASADAGAHTVHVLAWGANGASCQTDVGITVADSSTGSATSTDPVVPANAVAVTGIQQLPNWKADFDSNSGSGNSNGVFGLVSSPSLSGAALQLQTTFTNNGGERYHVTFGADPVATHFLYDAWLYVVSPLDSIANIEMDLNQVLANGQTVIYGFQCDGYSGTWDFSQNAGTPQAPQANWVHTSVACNPRSWTPDSWHHVQVMYSHDDIGNVTYQSVWMDGTRQDINQTVPSSFALGWGPALLTNFQVDGRGSAGSSTIYLDNLTVSRW